jgi:pimeloyl-ACP methyl ester carboxylesterase
MPFLQTPDLKIHYETAGTGENTFVLVHGNFGSWRWWRPVMDRLPANYRAFAPDMRGHGDTDRPPDGHTIEQLTADLYAFAKGLELTKFHLVGHSLGGGVAMQFTLDHPDMVQTLILIGPAPAEGMPNARKGGPFSSMLPGFLNPKRYLLSDTAIDAVYRNTRTLGTSRHIIHRALVKMTPTMEHKDDFESLVDDAVHMSPDAMVGHLKSLESWNVMDQLDKITTPTLILWGEKDSICPREGLVRTVERLKNGKLIVWRNCGHSPQMEKPDRFMNLLLKFAEKNTSDMVSDTKQGIGLKVKALAKRLFGSGASKS